MADFRIRRCPSSSSCADPESPVGAIVCTWEDCRPKDVSHWALFSPLIDQIAANPKTVPGLLSSFLHGHMSRHYDYKAALLYGSMGCHLAVQVGSSREYLCKRPHIMQRCCRVIWLHIWSAYRHALGGAQATALHSICVHLWSCSYSAPQEGAYIGWRPGGRGDILPGYLELFVWRVQVASGSLIATALGHHLQKRYEACHGPIGQTHCSACSLSPNLEEGQFTQDSKQGLQQPHAPAPFRRLQLCHNPRVVHCRRHKKAWEQWPPWQPHCQHLQARSPPSRQLCEGVIALTCLVGEQCPGGVRECKSLTSFVT